MKRIPTQALLEFGRKERVINRQIRERAEGKKVRPGLGRPAKKNNDRVSHQRRPGLAEKTAVHVTLRVRRHVPSLRARRRFNVIKHAFVRFCRARPGFRLVHFAVLSNHLHFIVEADSKPALSMGLQKLLHSISRRLNALNVKEQGTELSTLGGAYSRLRGWLGRVFADRYHAHVLKTPTEMAHAVRYVLENASNHYGASRSREPDPFTSLGAVDSVLVVEANGFLLARECRRYLAHLGRTREHAP